MIRDFHLGPLTLPAYMTMVMAGFLVALAVARRRALAVGIDPARIVDLGILCLVLAIVGARIMSVLTDGHFLDFVHLCSDPRRVEATAANATLCRTGADCGFAYLCDPSARAAVLAGTRRTMCYPPRDCLATLEFWHGGLTFYGGLLLAAPAGLWYARRHRLGALRTADLCAPAGFLGLAIGRLGCLFEGCCYGKPTSAWFGIHLPGHARPLHPTQLYEAMAALALAGALRWRGRRARRDGDVAGWGLAGYAVIRSIIEVFRADPRGSIGPLSTSQVISIAVFGLGLGLIIRARRSPGVTMEG